MRKSISQSLKLCSVFACLAGLSACSENDAANPSFKDIDRSNLPSNVVPNNDLSASSTEWTGWSANLVDTNGSQAAFSMVSTALSQGGNSLKTSITNVEAAGTADEIQVGPMSVPVVAGQAYGVAVFAQGPRCGLAKFVVSAADDATNVLAEEEFFFTGGLQSFDYYFQVPDTGVSSVNMPVQLSFADNIGSDIFIDRIIAIPTIMPSAGAEGNVARNSNFEESDTDINVPSGSQNSWASFVKTPPDGEPTVINATFTLDTTEAQDGNNSVRIDFEAAGEGNPYDIEAGPVNVDVVDGWTYTFSAWIKGDEGAQANFLVQNPTKFNVFNESGPVTVTSEWQEVRFEATVTETKVVRLYAQYNFAANANKTIYIDNIKLIPPDRCPYAPVIPNLVSTNEALFEYDHVSNGGLEASDTATSGWYTQAADASVATFDVNKALSNSGDNALKTTITTVGTNSWDIQAGPTDLEVIPGQTYIYSGWAKGVEGTKANFTAALQDAPYTTFEEHEVLFNGLWQQITFDFTVPSTVATTLMRMPVHMSYPENEGQRIFLDDFTLLPTNVSNGDLEGSDTEALGWSWQAPTDSATFVFDTTQAHTGSNSLKIDIAEMAADATINVWDIDAGITDIPVVGGLKYFISARVKGDEGAKLKLLLGSVEAPYDEYASAGGEDLAGGPKTDDGKDTADGIADGIEITEDWQEITFEADVPEGVEVVRLLAQFGFAENSNTSIYLDSFRVVSQIPPAPSADTANIISNGGLDAGKTDGWSANNATIAVTTSPEGVYSGNFGLHVTERTLNWNSAQYGLLDSGLENGSRYMASAWVKVDGDISDTLQLTLQITYDDGESQYIGITGSGDADTLGWTKLSGFFDYAPTGNVTDVKVYIEAAGDETSYFIDDLFITKVFTSNGNLESGETTGWNGSGDAQISASMDQNYTGDYSLYVSGRTANWNSAQFDLLNTGMELGKTYQISAWVKIDGDVADNIKMTIEVQDDDNDSNQYLTIAQSSETLAWVKLTNTYTFAPDGEATALKVYFEAEGDTSAYYIDDLVITEVIPPVSVIVNGGLEFGRTDGWVNAGDAVIEATQSGSGIYSGNFGLYVTGRTASWNSAQYGLTEAGLVEGASYIASAWVKVDGATADNLKLTLQISYETEEPQYITIAASGDADTLAWTKLSGMFNFAPIDTVTDVKVYIEADGETTTYFIDDLVIAQMFTVNGDLESAATTGWNGSGDAQLTASTDDSYSGDYSLFVDGRTTSWNSAQFDLFNSGMQVGKTYTISAWVKISGDTADTIKMTVEVQDDDNEINQYLTIAQSSETLTWVKLSSTYTYASDGTATVFKVYFEAEGDTSAYYIDDLVITEASESYSN